MSKVRILIADDHVMLAEALELLLRYQSDFEVVGLAVDGAEAIRMALEREPTVVLMDASMPNVNGVVATARIMAQCPGIRVLAMTQHADARTVQAMLEAGAAGYLLKSDCADKACEAIRLVARGGRYLSEQLQTAATATAPPEPHPAYGAWDPSGVAGASGGSGAGDQARIAAAMAIGKSIVAARQRAADPPPMAKAADPQERSKRNPLSAREQEIVHLLATGRSIAEIAQTLSLSPETVKTHRRNAMVKLGLNRERQLVRWALDRELG